MFRFRIPLSGVCLLAAFALATPAAGVLPTPHVNVMDFGAAGNAVIGDQSNDSDDAPAFRLAVDAAIAAGHGNVYVPCGNYRIGTTHWSTGLVLTDADDGLHLFGDGDCSLLMPAAPQGQAII